MSKNENETFASLFKKYRLRSEIETLSQFGDLLAQEGLIYENSLFTHWQKGDRVPKERKVILTIAHVFIKLGGMRNIIDVNLLLAAVGERDLSAGEIAELPDKLNLNGRMDNINKAKSHSKKAISKKQIIRFTYGVRSSPAAILMSGFYMALGLWWIFLNAYHLKNSPLNLAFGFAFGLVPLFGGISGLISLHNIHVKQSHIRQAVLFFSLGLITWGLGQMLWSVYNFFLNIEIPYPSLCDVGFIVSWPLWGIGLYYLGRGTRSQYASQVKINKASVAMLSAISMLIVYYLLIVVARNGAIVSHSDLLTIFFDLAYPLLDIALIVEAIILYGSSFRYVKKTYRWPVYFTLGCIVLNFFGDFGFSYTTRLGEYYNGGWVDFIFTTTFYLITIVINGLSKMESYAVIYNESKGTALEDIYIANKVSELPLINPLLVPKTQ